MLEFDLETASLAEQLQHFRATHAYKHYTIMGKDWYYLTGGQQNKEALLLLPGAPGLGEVAFQHIARFEHNYHVIAPSYPAGITTVDQLLDGISTLLNHERIEIAHVVGGSYSGAIAQCLVRRYPQRVGKLVLDHTGLPRQSRAGLYRCYYILLAALPLIGIRTLLWLGNHLFSRGRTSQQLFWRAYFDHDVIARLSKEDYLSRAQVYIDFHERYHFVQGEPLSWRGKLLIIEADNDTYVSPQEQAGLKALYPFAQIYTFSDTGHAAWSNQFDTFYSVIACFLQEAP